MGKIIAIANRKGGCAKTTTAGALCSGLGRLGYKVLGIDCDSQGNLSHWFKVDGLKQKNTTYEVITGKCSVEDAVVKLKYFDLIAASSELAAATVELTGRVTGGTQLKKSLEPVKDKYDFIIIDTPPALDIITANAFVAASEGIVLCTDAGMFAMTGMLELAKSLKEVQESFNKNARVIGILLTRFNPRLNAMKTMEELTRQYSEYFDAPIYETYIRQSVAIIESQIESNDIFDDYRVAGAIEDYKDFVLEFVEQQTGEKKERF